MEAVLEISRANQERTKNKHWYSQIGCPLVAKIRNWCALMPAGATLTNCYKLRKGDRDGPGQWAVPQSFSFMAREGLEGFAKYVNV